MEFHALTRKELQTLCKSNGIPANRSNAFMADALAQIRIPLSKVDANRQRNDFSTLSSVKLVDSTGSPFKGALTKKSNLDVKLSKVDETAKQPVFKNNFLRKGKRKDAPASQCSKTHHEEKEKHHNRNNSTKLLTDSPHRPVAAAAQEKVKSEVPADPTFPNLTRYSSAVVDNSLKSDTHLATTAGEAKVTVVSIDAPSLHKVTVENIEAPTSHDVTDAAKLRVVDKVRSQIEASLCSKVMQPPAKRPLVPSLLGLSVNILETKTEQGSCEVPNSTFEHSKQLKENCLSPVLSAPKSTLRGVNVLASTRQLEISPELITSPLSFSPLIQRVEEKVRSIVDRVHSFWKASDLAVKSSVD